PLGSHYIYSGFCRCLGCWVLGGRRNVLWGLLGLRVLRIGLLSRGLEVGKPSRRSLDSCVLEAPGNMFGAFFWLRVLRFGIMFSGLEVSSSRSHDVFYPNSLLEAPAHVGAFFVCCCSRGGFEGAVAAHAFGCGGNIKTCTH